MFVLHHGPKGSLPLMPAALLFLCLLSVSAGAADWPQWRGPERDGISPEKDLLQAWPEEGLTLLWKTHGLGKGFSSLAIAGRRIFTMGDLVDSQYLFALDAKRGRYLWKAKVGPAFANRYAGPRSTPTVNGDRVYALGTEGDLICADTATGEVKWRKSLPRDFGGKMMTHWKFSESPLADGDRVVVTPGGKEAALVALNKRGGAEIWRAAIPKLGSKGKDGAGYSSIVVSEGAGIRQYVQLMGRGVVSVEASTGRFLWGYNRVANGTANVATPLVDGDYVFASTGYGTGSVLLRLSPAGNDIRAEEVYFVEGGHATKPPRGSDHARWARLWRNRTQERLSNLPGTPEWKIDLGAHAQCGQRFRGCQLRRWAFVLPVPGRLDDATGSHAGGLSREGILYDPRSGGPQLVASGHLRRQTLSAGTGQPLRLRYSVWKAVRPTMMFQGDQEA